MKPSFFFDLYQNLKSYSASPYAKERKGERKKGAVRKVAFAFAASFGILNF
jgi:hypothetical protein